MKSVKMAPYSKVPEDRGYSVLDLLEQMPSVMLVVTSTLSFPSLSLLNNLFLSGELDAGMSGGVCWEPFELSQGEWEELKDAIARKYSLNLEAHHELDALSEYSDWTAAALKYCHRESS